VPVLTIMNTGAKDFAEPRIKRETVLFFRVYLLCTIKVVM